MQRYRRFLLDNRVSCVIKHALSTSKACNLDVTKSSNQITHNPATERKMTALELQHLVRKGKKIAMITAYDYPTVLFFSYNRRKMLFILDCFLLM